MSASGPVRDGPSGQERMEELFGSVFDLADKIAPRVSPNEVEARLRRTLQEAHRDPGGMPAEPTARRFRTGEVPPLAGGYTDRPDTAHGIVTTLVPGSTVALVPAQAAAEGPSNWLGACGKTQIAVIIAESLCRSGAIDVLWAEGCHPLLLRVGRCLDDARLVGSAVEYWRDLAPRCDTKLTPGHSDALVVATQLAAAYLAAGNAGEAVHRYRRVLAVRARELAPGHPAIIAARVSLAKALIMADEPADAVTVLHLPSANASNSAVPAIRTLSPGGTSSPPPTRPQATSRRPPGY